MNVILPSVIAIAIVKKKIELFLESPNRNNNNLLYILNKAYKLKEKKKTKTM